MSEIYRAGPIKRARRTDAEIDQLDRQILNVLRQDHPQSVRHVYYRMTDPRLAAPVMKDRNGEKKNYRAVQDRCKKLRLSGELPYGWIADTTRRGWHTNAYASAGDFLNSIAGLYRSNLWESVPILCEVWCESRSLAGVLERVCDEYAVSLYPAGGFSSLTLIYESAQHLNVVAPGRKVVIFYIGDYDPAGVLIDRDIERKLRSHLDSKIPLEFVRLGVTAEQVEQYDLPKNERNPKDKRSPEVEWTVEAEAMPAAQMRALLRESIELLLPAHALEVARVAEESEREWLVCIAQAMAKDGDA